MIYSHDGYEVHAVYLDEETGEWLVPIRYDGTVTIGRYHVTFESLRAGGIPEHVVEGIEGVLSGCEIAEPGWEREGGGHG